MKRFRQLVVPYLVWSFVMLLLPMLLIAFALMMIRPKKK